MSAAASPADAASHHASPVLVVAATALELAPLLAHLSAPTPASSAWGPATAGVVGATPVIAQALGIGKANTAAGVVAALLEWRPLAVVQVGIGGAYVGSFLSVGMVAAATLEVDLDLGVRSRDGWSGLGSIGIPLTHAVDGRPERFNEVPTSAPLTRALDLVAGVPGVRFATLDALTGDVDTGACLASAHDVAIESMEGVAAAQVCDRLGVPFAEVRGVSNVVGERDRGRWNVRAASHASAGAVRALLLRWGDVEETRALVPAAH